MDYFKLGVVAVMLAYVAMANSQSESHSHSHLTLAEKNKLLTKFTSQEVVLQLLFSDIETNLGQMRGLLATMDYKLKSQLSKDYFARNAKNAELVRQSLIKILKANIVFLKKTKEALEITGKLATSTIDAHTHTDSGHTHTHTDSGHTHTHTDSGHTHTHTDSGHTHTHTDSGHTHTHTDAGHTHSKIPVPKSSDNKLKPNVQGKKTSVKDSTVQVEVKDTATEPLAETETSWDVQTDQVVKDTATEPLGEPETSWFTQTGRVVKDIVTEPLAETETSWDVQTDQVVKDTGSNPVDGTECYADYC